jgi:protoheme ferro-lyase
LANQQFGRLISGRIIQPTFHSCGQQLINLYAEAESKNNSALHVLFSAHSLPMKIVQRANPYPDDIARTVKAVTSDLTHPWSLAFQSRNGKLAMVAALH